MLPTSTPSLGAPPNSSSVAIKLFSGAVAGDLGAIARGVSYSQSLYFVFVLLVLFLVSLFFLLQNFKTQKISVVFIPVLLFYLIIMSSTENTKLCDFTSTNNNYFICSPIAPPATKAESYEIKPALLNLVMKEQFSGASTDDAASHLNNFVELCDMQKYKEVESDIIKLKLFPFSLRGRSKEWLLSFPKNSIDSWIKCKDAFIGKYYPPAKIIQLRSNNTNFRQFDNEHVAQAWRE